MRALGRLYWVLRNSLADILLLVPVLLLFFCYKRDRYRRGDSGTPILFIHGNLHNSSAWHYLDRQLRRQGVANTFTINLGHPFQRMEDFEGAIVKKVAQIQALTGCHDIVLIGHSLGGVLGAACALKGILAVPVRKVITLGSPLQGTRLARLGLGAAIHQLYPGEPYLQALSQLAQRNSTVSLVTFASAFDPLVLPSANLTWPAAVRARRYLINHLSHISYLYSKDVADIILRELSAAATAR